MAEHIWFHPLSTVNFPLTWILHFTRLREGKKVTAVTCTLKNKDQMDAWLAPFDPYFPNTFPYCTHFNTVSVKHALAMLFEMR